MPQPAPTNRSAPLDVVAVMRALEAAGLAVVKRAQSDSYDIGPAPSVRADGDAWVVEMEGEEIARTETRTDAFAVVRDTAWFTEALERKQPDALGVGERLAEPRWIDAASEEDVEAIAGGQLTAEGIDEIVRNLAGIRTAPIVDGGGVSEVHASVTQWSKATLAAGYVLVGVRVVGTDGEPHLWLYVTLLPEVDDAVERGMLLFGSVAFVEEDVHPYTGDPIGARLISYALTDKPYIGGLEPHAPRNAVRSADQPRVVRARSRMLMNKTTQAAKEAALARARSGFQARGTLSKNATRGQLLDALRELATKFGITWNDKTSAFDLAWQIEDRVYALGVGASVEDNVPNFSSPAPAAPSAASTAPATTPDATAASQPAGDASRSQQDPAASQQDPAAASAASSDSSDPAARADDAGTGEKPSTDTNDTSTEKSTEAAERVDGFDSDEAAMLWLQSDIDFWREVTGMTEATPAELADARDSAKDAIAAVLAGKADDDDESDESDEGSATADVGSEEPVRSDAPADPTTPAAPDATRSTPSAEEAATARAELAAMNARVKAAEAEKKKAEDELKALKDAAARASLEQHLDERYRSAGLPPPEGDDRTELLALLDKVSGDDAKKQVIDRSLRSVNVPPKSTVMGGDLPKRSVNPPGTEVDDQDAAIREEIEAVRAQNPRWTPAQILAEASNRAAKKRPHLFMPKVG